MMCAIHGKQTIAEKMKADLDEMKENADEELQVPEKYLEVFTESPTTRSFILPQGCKTKSGLLSMVPPYADHYVLPSHEIPIRNVSTRWGQTTPSMLHDKSG